MSNMQESMLADLNTQRPALRRRWEQALRATPPTSPLGHPDALVHLMDWTLDRLTEELTLARRVRAIGPAPCPCGHNPLLTYFATAEEALLTTLQDVGKDCTPLEREIARHEVMRALQQISNREISSFCSLCRYRKEATCPRKAVNA